MIDLSLIQKDPVLFLELVKKKEPDFDGALLVELEQKVRSAMQEVENLRHHKNKLAEEGKQGVNPVLRAQSIEVGKNLKEYELLLHDVQGEFKALLLRCPNLCLPDVPVGGKELNNVVKTVGEKPTFDFPIKHHLELGVALGWFDFEVASHIAGSNFVMYKGDGVKLQYALLMFMLQHNASYGFSYIIPPYVATEKSLEIAGNFPKFYDDVYAVQKDGLYLIPTSEVSLANVYRDTIFSREQLPIRLTAATSCFRREAGGYGASERGLIRIHQFEKVELYVYCEQENSSTELDRMVACAEEIVKKLGLHYRISLLATQDCSFSSAKTFDIEVWLPEQRRYMEISSCSNCTDFQARRAATRYRKEQGGKTTFVHTLNGSSLALPRLTAALMETYQQSNGTIVIPEILRPWML